MCKWQFFPRFPPHRNSPCLTVNENFWPKGLLVLQKMSRGRQKEEKKARQYVNVNRSCPNRSLKQNHTSSCSLILCSGFLCSGSRGRNMMIALPGKQLSRMNPILVPLFFYGLPSNMTNIFSSRASTINVLHSCLHLKLSFTMIACAIGMPFNHQLLKYSF